MRCTGAFLLRLPQTRCTLETRTDRIIDESTQAQWSTEQIPSFCLAMQTGGETVPFRYRNVVHALRTLLLRIDVSELQFTPDTGPPYGEYVTGKQFRELTDEVRAEFPFVSPLAGKCCVPLVVMYSSDNMVAGELHKTTFHPG